MRRLLNPARRGAERLCRGAGRLCAYALRCAGRVAARVGRRGCALLFFTLLGASFGLSLAVPSRQATSQVTVFASHVLPLKVWAALWLTAGIMALVYAFRQFDAPGFLATQAVTTAWALVAFGSWLFGHTERGWVSGLLFLALAAWIYVIATWPEPVTERP